MFGHHCAHLQECKTVQYCIWFSALEVLAGVLGRREAGRVHCVEAVCRLHCLHSAHDPRAGVPKLQLAL